MSCHVRGPEQARTTGGPDGAHSSTKDDHHLRGDKSSLQQHSELKQSRPFMHKFMLWFHL